MFIMIPSYRSAFLVTTILVAIEAFFICLHEIFKAYDISSRTTFLTYKCVTNAFNCKHFPNEQDKGQKIHLHHGTKNRILKNDSM